MTQLFGVDISTVQGTIDFKTLSENKDFVLIKTTEGNGYEDAQFQTNRGEARKYFKLRGYFHEIFHRNNPEDEANWFLSRIDDLNGEMLLFIWGDYPEPGIDIGQWSGKFIDTLRIKYPGCNPLFYGNLSTINGGANLAEIWQNRDCGLWVANPDNNPDSIPETQWPVVAIKQYQFGELGGRAPGISEPVDLDVFYGDAETFLKYCWFPQVTPPTPIPEPKIYTQSDLDAKLEPLNASISTLTTQGIKDNKTIQDLIVKNQENKDDADKFRELSNTQGLAIKAANVKIIDLQNQLKDAQRNSIILFISNIKLWIQRYLSKTSLPE